MSHATFLSVDLDAKAAKPLFQQLYDALSQAIQKGQIRAGTQLPASRVYAREIGVSRGTVLAAYDQLIAEGYAKSRRGAGVFATDIGATAQEWLPQCTHPHAQVPKPTPVRLFAHGMPDMRAFPHAQWAQYVGRVARSEANGLSEITDRFGDWPLRCAIAAHLRDWRGVSISPEQVVITAGSGDAMELILQTVAPENAWVGLENPGYPMLVRVCKSLGKRPHWLAVDAQGACLPTRDVAVSVITPSCQYPLGGTMPVARRQAHLAAAKWLIEDDYDSEFRYAGLPVPALMAMDQNQKVIYLGSFSKVFSTGMRIGYLVLPDPLIAPMRDVIGQRGVRASAMPQRVLARFMEDGAFYRHVRKMRRLYRGRRDVFLKGIKQGFDGMLTFHDHGAGMSVALHFVQPFKTAQVQENLKAVGLKCASLASYYGGGGVKDGLLCGFCAFDEAEILQGLEQMQAALGPLDGTG
jgi:GntR family transcriptional regulator/MocR family aminotransferase